MDAKHLFNGVVNETSQTVSIGALRDERNTTFVSYFLVALFLITTFLLNFTVHKSMYRSRRPALNGNSWNSGNLINH